MTFDLMIMRHAKSSWESGALTDWHRPLTPKGERDAVRMARWMSRNDAIPNRILSSDAVRAASTVDIVADTLGLDPSCMEFRNDLYMTVTQNWISHIQKAVAEARSDGFEDFRLLVCGHNPTLDSLAAALAIEPLYPTDEGKILTTASAVQLRFSGPVGRNAGHVVAFVRPTELDPMTY